MARNEQKLVGLSASSWKIRTKITIIGVYMIKINILFIVNIW